MVNSIMQDTPFQSTLPVWGATIFSVQERRSENISIHAPRVGSDKAPVRRINHAETFQSTLPVWGATLHVGGFVILYGISIHAPRVGSDTRPQPSKNLWRNFNPRSPCGERPKSPIFWRLTAQISIHAPRVGSDVVVPIFQATTHISIHAPRVGSDLPNPLLRYLILISIHAPRVGSDSKHAQIHFCNSFIIRQNYRKRQLISACNTCFTAHSLEKSMLLKVRTSRRSRVRLRFALLLRVLKVGLVLSAIKKYLLSGQ